MWALGSARIEEQNFGNKVNCLHREKTFHTSGITDGGYCPRGNGRSSFRKEE